MLQYSPMNIDPPDVFLRLCKFYHLEPERVINALLFSFCLAPPRNLILVERAEARAKSSVVTATPP